MALAAQMVDGEPLANRLRLTKGTRSARLAEPTRAVLGRESSSGYHRKMRNPWVWYDRHLLWPILIVLSFLALLEELYRFLFR